MEIPSWRRTGLANELEINHRSTRTHQIVGVRESVFINAQPKSSATRNCPGGFTRGLFYLVSVEPKKT